MIVSGRVPVTCSGPAMHKRKRKRKKRKRTDLDGGQAGDLGLLGDERLNEVLPALANDRGESLEDLGTRADGDLGPRNLGLFGGGQCGLGIGGAPGRDLADDGVVGGVLHIDGSRIEGGGLLVVDPLAEGKHLG